MIVVHGISLPPGEFGGEAIERLFTNRLDAGAHPAFAPVAALRVSAHFLVRRDGALVQFVPCVRRAWHAGESAWRGRPRCNDYSIGIELEGTDDLAYEAAQYAMLAQLIRALRRRYPIGDIVGHSDIAPGRKTDPGAAFDWTRLARALGGRLPQRTDPARSA
jgi:N-acetyl-anhydromuramoyl-L-alanine amidase